MSTIQLFLLVNVLTIGQSRRHEAKYEVLKEFNPSDSKTSYEPEKEWYKRSHQVKRRAVPTTSSVNTTTQPTTMPPVTHSTTRQMNTTNAFATNVSFNEDNHKYYKSYYDASGIKRWWFNIDDDGTPKIHEKSKYSDTVKTSFQFPYYGHVMDKVTITNRGFLFMGDRVHKFNASAQYIAPLMADFAAELHEDTKIRYIDTGDRFTAEWRNMRLRNQSVGEFSFQCSIFKDGRVVFAYKNVPVPVSEIKNDSFYVRVGFSDSFDLHHIIRGNFTINGQYYNGLHYVVYFRYHHVELNSTNIRNGSAFVITPLPNCVIYKACDSCIQSNTAFSCEWCPRLKRCSDGVDRYRHDWLVARCSENSMKTCRPFTTTAPTEGVVMSRDEGHGAHAAGTAILVLVCVAIVLGVVGWFVYAYRNPDTSSGMCLIRYGNPRKWWRGTSGGAEPTSGGAISFQSMANESNA